MNLPILRPLRWPAMLCVAAASLGAAEPLSPDVLLPVPAAARKVLNQSCVMCHGEVFDGKAEIREELDLSTDEAIKATLADPERLREMIATGEMPHDARLSFRLRKQPALQERLKTLKAEYDQNGSKETLMTWLNAVLPPHPEPFVKKEKKKKE